MSPVSILPAVFTTCSFSWTFHWLRSINSQISTPKCPSSISDYAARIHSSAPSVLRSCFGHPHPSAKSPVLGRSSIALMFQRSAVSSERKSRRFRKASADNTCPPQGGDHFETRSAQPLSGQIFGATRISVACSHPVIMSLSLP
jgi:hypothetical protein